MKIHKLIELWKEMEITQEAEEKEAKEKEAKEKGAEMASESQMFLEKLDPEELLNTMQFLQRCAAQAGYYYNLQAPGTEFGTLALTVTENDNPIVAQAKIWDNKEHKIRTRFSLRRFVTEENGTLSAKLPCGSYEAEVTCGPEYSTEIVPFEITKDGVTTAKATLTRIAHLTDKGWMAGDLHHHSVYSSPAYGGTDPVIETPEQICRSMKSLGMQFGALSDHHNVLNHDEWRQQNHNFVPIVSKEISTSNGHVLQLGVDDDVIYEIPNGKERTTEKLRNEFIRICTEIREKGGLPQVNHPFDVSFSTRYNSEFWDMVEIFETIEIWNGATPFASGTINAKAFKKWLSLLEEGKRLTATTGSDTHNIYGDDYFGMTEWLDWLMDTVINHPEIYPVQMTDKVAYLTQLYKKIWPRLLAWVEQSNTPSNIHNYVYTNGKNQPEEILQAIRDGHSFISNGPLMTASINGASYGEKTSLTDKTGTLSIHVFSKKPINHLWMYTGADKKVEICTKVNAAEGGFTYDVTTDEFNFGDAAWAVFVADGGENAIAIANPILLA